MSSVQIVFLGAVAGLTIFLGLPVGRMQSVSPATKSFLSAMATGILIFLLWDVLTAAVEPVEEALTTGNDGRFLCLAILLTSGFAVGLMSLALYDGWLRRRRAKAMLGPGAASIAEYQVEQHIVTMARLDPPVRAALRLGAYQLGYVDGVARYAAVNESVELVRRAGLERAVAFTNAVLRRVEHGIGALLASLDDDTATQAALAHSYPDWIAETWWRDLGAEDARTLMRALNEPASTVVRLVRGEVEGVVDADVPGAWHVGRIDERALADGRIWPQSVASQLVGLAVGAREGERTLDVCAAPGGKATMAQEGRGIGLLNKLRAYDLQANGLDTVEANLALGFPPDAREWGIGNQILADLGLTTIRILTNNPRKLTGLDGFGLTVVEQVPLETEPTAENARYLAAKREKLGHTITRLHHQGARLEDETPEDTE